jgi:hypothetical protein
MVDQKCNINRGKSKTDATIQQDFDEDALHAMK